MIAQGDLAFDFAIETGEFFFEQRFHVAARGSALIPHAKDFLQLVERESDRECVLDQPHAVDRFRGIQPIVAW